MFALNKSSYLKKILFSFIVFVGVFCFYDLAHAASLSLSPSTGVYSVGSNISVRVNVNTSGASINAAEGVLSFNPNDLTVVSVTKGTIFGLWAVEPSFSNSAGTVTFGGGSPSGYTGNSGTVLTVNFRAKNAGTSRVTFKNGSVLAADGLGTNVLKSMNGSTLTITAVESTPEAEVVEYIAAANTPGAPKVTSLSHTDPTLWYQAKTADLSWQLPAGVTAVRTSLDRSASAVPSKVYEPPIENLTLSDLEDGVQYFHIQFRNADGWGKVTNFRLAVDSERPNNLSIKLAPDNDQSHPEQRLEVSVTESVSSIDYYLVKIDDGEPIKIDSNYGSSSEVITLPALSPGYHSLALEAFDMAGNSIVDTFAFSISAFEPPIFTDYPERLNSGVIPVIKGQTRPNSKVTVYLSRTGSSASPDQYEVASSELGEFNFIPDRALQEGVYEISAKSTDSNGSQSEVSEPIRLIVELPGYLRLGNMMISVMSVIVPLIALLALLVLLLVYFLRRLRLLTRFVGKETKEALEIVEAEFSSLKTKLDSLTEDMRSSRKTNKLTKSEEILASTMAKALKEAKAKIDKEVSDVDDIIE